MSRGAQCDRGRLLGCYLVPTLLRRDSSSCAHLRSSSRAIASPRRLICGQSRAQRSLEMSDPCILCL